MVRGSKVVLVLDDGSRLRGVMEGFRPERPRLVLKELDETGRLHQIRDVDSRKVAAAFFVRDLRTGRIRRAEPGPRESVEDLPRAEEIHRITFLWGEKLPVRIEAVDRERRWMFVYPDESSDRSDNIDRIFVTTGAITEIRKEVR